MKPKSARPTDADYSKIPKHIPIFYILFTQKHHVCGTIKKGKLKYTLARITQDDCPRNII